MKFSFTTALVVALAAEGAVASTWFSKAAYNKWHETELERWLSDHNIPYPSPADRKDLENLVKSNWESKVVKPYNEWDAPQLQSYLQSKGHEVQKGVEVHKDSLLSQVKAYWTDTADSASESYASVKDWIFNSWSNSQLKSFLDRHGVPAPQPTKRDSLLATARQHYEAIAKKVGETAQYPGNWLYETWSESDLKEWLDERGIPVPQPTTRDKLIASVRRHARLSGEQSKSAAAAASSSAAAAASSLSSSAVAAQESLSDAVFDAWSDSKLKEWFDKQGIKVPQGTKRNELIALARKHRAELSGEKVASSASSYFGAATTKAGNQFAKATDDAQLAAEDAFDSAINTWSDSRLKAFLDARGVPVPQANKRDELLAQVRLNKHKAATGWSAWTFDTWTTDNLKSWLSSQNNKAAKKSGATRDELAKAAQDQYNSASKAGGDVYASATSYLASATDAAKDTTFDTWSESDLKNYLDSYGIPVPHTSKTDELRAAARRNAMYFRYGTSTPQGTIYAKLQDTANWLLDYVKVGLAGGRKEAQYQGEKAADYAKEGAHQASHRASESYEKATDKVKEEL